MLALGLVLASRIAAPQPYVSHFTVRSRFVHASLRETLVRPGGLTSSARPLIVFLHGRGMHEDSSLNAQMVGALSKLGARAPDIVFPDGGNHSYWHDRHGAAWGKYVIDEVIPQAVKRLGADPRRVAIGGWLERTRGPGRASRSGSTPGRPTRSTRATVPSSARSTQAACACRCIAGPAATPPRTGAATGGATSASTRERWRAAVLAGPGVILSGRYSTASG